MTREARHAKLRSIALTHSQALWVLRSLGFGHESGPTVLDAYLKYLRREGVPFARDERPGGPGHRATYRYEHLMEVALALDLRSHAILPKDVVRIIAEVRSELRPIFDLAYVEHDIGRGAPIEVRVDGKSITMSGVYLLLSAEYIDAKVPQVVGPYALSPADAVRRFMMHHSMVYARDPIPISHLALDVVRLAEGVNES